MAIIVFFVVVIKKENKERERAEQAGMIRVQYSSESFKDENYKTVKMKLEDAGFTNIETVDLEDAGIAFWNFGKVEFVSIDGSNYFTASSYFMPDVKIVIYHH